MNVQKKRPEEGVLIQGLESTFRFFTEAVAGTIFMAQAVSRSVPAGNAKEGQGPGRISPEGRIQSFGPGPERGG